MECLLYMCSINVQHLVGAEHSRINKAVFWTMKILIFIFKHWVLIFLKEILIEYTTSNIVSPLHMNLDASNFQRMCLQVQLHKLVPMSGVCCHVGTPLHVLVYFTVHYCV